MNTQAWKQMYMYQKYRDCLMENFWMEREGALYLGVMEEQREREMKRADIVITLETLGFTPSPELVDSVLKEMLKNEPPKDMCLIVRDEEVHAKMVEALSQIDLDLESSRPSIVRDEYLSIGCNLGSLSESFSMTIDSMKEMHEAWKGSEEKTMAQKKAEYRENTHKFLNGGKKW
ncbi:hypothetical protein P4639_22190 [Priestia megaterium]|uniref:hypothetical protein n=1 Tax=Priestia megaterium TaxID=1404 RepID=UPI002E23D0E3|nr:hypothetical protein [Priestia megaterium]